MWTCSDGISIASGCTLDAIANILGIKRRKYLIFSESDNVLRNRCKKKLGIIRRANIETGYRKRLNKIIRRMITVV